MTGAAFAVERAGSLDLGELVRLHNACFDEAWTPSAFAHALAQPGGLALMARRGDRTIGFVLCRRVIDECEILSLAIEAPFRRHGFGRSLLDAALDAVVAGGARTVFLEVAEDNAAARSLYARAGFARVGVREGYYRRGARRVDAWTLKRAIAC